jgi:hypothetical protein
MADIPSDIDFTSRDLGGEVEMLEALRGVDSLTAIRRHTAAREALADFIRIAAAEAHRTQPMVDPPLEAGREWLTTVLSIPIYAEDFAAPGGIREAIRGRIRTLYIGQNARGPGPLAMRMVIARPLKQPDKNADVFGPETPRIDFFAPAKFVADVGRPAQPEFLGRIALDMAYQEVAPGSALGDYGNPIPWPDGFDHMVEAVLAIGRDDPCHGVVLVRDRQAQIVGLGVASRWRARAGDFGISVFDEHNRERILVRKGVAGLDDAVIVYPVEA